MSNLMKKVMVMVIVNIKKKLRQDKSGLFYKASCIDFRSSGVGKIKQIVEDQ